ncbi:hypothetical protein [Streptococcus suis]|uniref:hypothetical protein n=1 Tax=Streptococcus suis TaxID=1307 RepID=UPI0003F8F19A|nr:hypothetical protein [Streptococcus suis]
MFKVKVRFNDGSSLDYTSKDEAEENKKFAELDKVHQLLKAVECEDLMAPITVGQQILSIIDDLYKDEEQFGGQLLLPSPDNTYNFVIRVFREKDLDEAGESRLSKVSTREMMYNLFMRNSNDRKLSTKINMVMDNHPDWEKKQFRLGGKVTKGFKRKVE